MCVRPIGPMFAGRTPLSTYQHLKSLAHVPAGAVARPAGLRNPAGTILRAQLLPRPAFAAPAGTLSFFWITSTGLSDAPARKGQEPSLAGNEKRE
jgi:hypothetical protein